MRFARMGDMISDERPALRAQRALSTVLRWPAVLVARWQAAKAGCASAALLMMAVGWAVGLRAAPAIGPPPEPGLAQVYAVLDTYCAGCHQSGKLYVPSAGGGLANILALDEIASEPHLIRHGVPDASRLYHVLLDRHRPLDLAREAPWPNTSEIRRVRAFIAERANPVRNCAARDLPLTTDSIAAAIDRTVGQAADAGADLRFITLTHLYNACATPAELDGYRQALARALNSLSWGIVPVTLRRADATGTVLAVKLADIGWTADHWDTVAAAEPPGVALDLRTRLRAPAADPRPIRGDWLAGAVFEAPLYDELLGLPQTLEASARLLGISREADAGTPRAPRAGLRQSVVTRGPRVIERYQAENRRMWLAYDFSESGGERDIFERPLGFVTAAEERHRFRPDGMRALFMLPNGYLAYAVFDADGRKRADVPSAIETPVARWAGHGTPAACVACHSTGPRPFADAIRDHVASEKFSGPREVKDAALAIYPSASDWNMRLEDDAFRFRRAVIQSGVDPDLTVHGLDPVTALARRYRLSVDMAGLAAEALITPAALEAKLSALASAGEPASFGDPSIVPRLRQGTLSRREANAVLATLRGVSAAAGPGPSVTDTPAPLPEPMRLSIWTDRQTYRSGDGLTIHAATTTACYLTLIGIDAAGKATILFPSEFEPDNAVTPGRIVSVPAAGAQYQFRLRQKGSETIVGLCQAGAKHLPTAEPDYERQRFTVLGNYENFERSAFEVAAEPGRSSRAARGAGSKPGFGTGKPDTVTRAAVRIEIK